VGHVPHGRYASSTVHLRFSRPVHAVVRQHAHFVSIRLWHLPYMPFAFADPCNRYYLSDLLNMVGITDGVTKSKINIGIACWGLVCGTALALTAPRFKRRPIYLTCASCLLCVYIAWTISMERFMSTKAQSAAILTIFFIFAYSPAYNLGYNALTYSACPFRFITCVYTDMNKRIWSSCSLTSAGHAVSPGSSSMAAAQASLPPT
jgi:hypothetical protein